MRPAHTFPTLTLAAALAAALPAWAQSPPPSSAADATAATLPLQHAPLSASGGVETGQTDWRSAHEAVAAFPRGHADIAAWEAAQARGAASQPAPGPAQATPRSAPSMPPGMPHHKHHGGQP